MANTAQIEHWNSGGGERWVREQTVMDALLDAHGAAALNAANLAPGEHVLDVGCGCGATTLDLATRVGPEGLAVGVDISQPMLERARQRAREAGLGNVRFERGDAQIHVLPERRFDAMVSRFGVMFFEDPVAAFANLRQALREGGRLSFVCWQDVENNPWMAVPARALAGIVTLEPVVPHAPGPFAFASKGHVRDILDRAGFTGVNIEPLSLPITVPGSVMEAARVFTTFGIAGRSLLNAPESTRARAVEAVTGAVAPYVTDGGVTLGSHAWIVTARAHFATPS